MCFLEGVGVVDGSIVVGGRGKGVLFVCLFVWDSVVVVEWFPYCLFVIGVGQSVSLVCALGLQYRYVAFSYGLSRLGPSSSLLAVVFVAPGLDYYSLYVLPLSHPIGRRASFVPQMKMQEQNSPIPILIPHIVA